MAKDVSDGRLMWKMGADLSELDSATDKAKKKFDEVSKTAEKAGKNIDKAFSPAKPKEFKSVIESLTGTIDQNEKYLAELINEQKAHAAALERGKKVTSEYIAKHGQLSQEIQYVRQMLQLQRAEMAAGAGSIAALEARVKMLTLSYRQLSTAEQQGVVGRRLREAINSTNVELDKARKRMEDVGKSATSMGSQVASGAGKAFSFLRTLAYLIPGLGLAGLIGMITDGIVALVKELIKGNGAFNKFKEGVEATAAALKSSEYQSARVTVAQLTHEIKLARDGIISKEQVTKHYNETVGKTMGTVSSFAELENKWASQASDFIEVTKQKAKALALYAKAAQMSADAELEGIREYSLWDDIKATRNQLSFKEKAKVLGVLGLSAFTGNLNSFFGVWNEAADKARQKQRKETADKLNKDADEIVKLADEAMNKVFEKSKELEVDFSGRKYVEKVKEDLTRINNLLNEVSQAKNKYEIQFSPNEESEEKKINAYFDNLKKKVDDFNKDPKHKIKLTPDQISKANADIEEARQYALQLQEQRVQGDKLLDQLQEQKQLYKEYEDFKERYGKEAADRLYGDLAKKYATYLDVLKAEQKKLEDKGSLTPAEAVTYSNILKEIARAEEDAAKLRREQRKKGLESEEQSYNEILKRTRDYYIQMTALQANYNKAKAALDRKDLPEDEYNKQLTALDNFYKSNLKRLNILYADISQKITPEFIGEATKSQVLSVIREIERIVRTGKMQDAMGRIVDVPPDVLLRLKDAQEQIKRMYEDIVTLNNSTSNMGRVAKVVGDVGAALQELGKGISAGGGSEVGAVISKLGNFLINIQQAYQRIAKIIDKVNDAMKVASETGDAVSNVLDSNDWVGLIVSLVNLILTIADATDVISQYYKELARLQRQLAEHNADIVLGEYKITEQKREQARLDLERIKLTKEQIKAQEELAKKQVNEIQKEFDEIFEQIQGGEFISNRYIHTRGGLSKALGKKPYEVIEYSSLASFKLEDVEEYFRKNGIFEDETFKKLAKDGRIAMSDLQKSLATGLFGFPTKGLLTQYNTAINELIKDGKKLGVTFEELEALDAKGLLDGATKKFYDRLVELKKQGADVNKELEETVRLRKEIDTGTTADAMLDSIVQMFKNGKTAAEDFAENFEELMREAMFNSLKYDYLQKPIQDFYEQFAAYASDGLTQSEIDQLRLAYKQIFDDANEQFENLKQVTGINDIGGGRNKNTMAGAFSAASQESIDLLAGHTMGMRVAQLKTNELLEAGFLDMGQLMSRGIDKLDNIERNTYNTYNELKILNNKIQGASDVALAIGGV